MYRIITEGQKKAFTASTLYAGCKSLINLKGGALINDGALVAFWCAWDCRVKAGFKATETERQAINDYGLVA